MLLVLFIAGIASAWARGLRIDCGCFGGDGSLAWDREPAYLQEILRDLGFLALAAWLALRPRTPVAVDNRLNGSGSARAATTASPAGVGTGTTP